MLSILEFITWDCAESHIRIKNQFDERNNFFVFSKENDEIVYTSIIIIMEIYRYDPYDQWEYL